MRTTVTLDPDTEQLIRRRMRERNQSFKDAVNDAIRTGVTSQRDPQRFVTQTAALGTSRVNLDRSLQIAADLEDDELIRKMRSAS